MKKTSLIQKHILALRAPIAAQILFWMISTAAMALIPAYNRHLIDAVIPRQGEGLPPLVAAYGVTYGVFLITAWLSERLLWKCGIKFENGLKKNCFDKLVNISYNVFSEKKTGEYISMLTKNISTLEQDYLTPLCALIKDFLAIFIYTIIIAYTTSPLICVVLLTCSFFAAFSPRIYKMRLKKTYKDYVDEAATYTKRISDILDGFDMTDNKIKKSYTNANIRFTDILSVKRWRYGRTKVNSNTISGTLSIIMIDISIFIMCAYLALNGHITVGIVVASLTYTRSFMDPLNDMLYCINALNSTKGIAAELDMFLQNENGDGGNTICNKPLSKISCKNIEIDFGQKKLRYNNITIEMGKKYVLHGESGKGKSTLLRILAGQVNYSGENLVDDMACSLSSDSYFYMSQNQHIFSEDFFTNVSLFGAYSYEYEQLREFFDRFDRGEHRGKYREQLFETISTSQDCSRLSGGERQAVKMCRMFVQGKELLLLDEPFSALDNESASKLLDSLNAYPATIMLVTHNRTFKALNGWEHIDISEVCYEV